MLPHIAPTVSSEHTTITASGMSRSYATVPVKPAQVRVRSDPKLLVTNGGL